MSNYPSQKKALNRLVELLKEIEYKYSDIIEAVEFNKNNTYPDLAFDIGELRNQLKELKTEYQSTIKKLKL